jgi:hypothetical protein
MITLACPQCGDSSSLRTLERILGHLGAGARVRGDGETTIDWGSTTMLWDTSTTIAWGCSACSWEGPDGVTDPTAVLAKAASS